MDVARATGVFGRDPIASEFGQPLLDANRAVHEAAGLVMDDHLRHLVL
jgi:hypothetical protein